MFSVRDRQTDCTEEGRETEMALGQTNNIMGKNTGKGRTGHKC